MSLITGALTLPKQAPTGVPVAAYLAVCINAAGQLVLVDESGGLAALGITAGKTVTFPQSLAFPSGAGTTGQQLTTDGAGTLSWAAGSALTVGTTAISGGTTTRILFDNAGVVGEYAISGTGSVAMTTSPTFVTPILGAASATSLTITGTTSLLLGTAGSAVGNIGFRNATSGTATLAPPTGALGTYTVTLPGVASTLATLGANTYTGAQTINAGGGNDITCTNSIYVGGNVNCALVAPSNANATFLGVYLGSGTGIYSTGANKVDLSTNSTRCGGFSATGFDVVGTLAVTGASAQTGLASFAGGVKLTGTTIAALPASPAAGTMASITDGDAALGWGATAINSGGGATKYLVWYNGTNWTIAGK